MIDVRKNARRDVMRRISLPIVAQDETLLVHRPVAVAIERSRVPIGKVAGRVNKLRYRAHVRAVDAVESDVRKSERLRHIRNVLPHVETDRKIDILEKRLIVVHRIILSRRYDDGLATPVARRGHEPGARRRGSLNGTHVVSAQYRYFEIIAGRVAAHRVRRARPRSGDGNEGGDVQRFPRVGDDVVEEVERLQAAETVSD